MFRGEETSEMPSLSTKEKNIVDILVDTKLCPSKSEARRLVVQGGISIGNEKITDPNYKLIKL